MTLVLNEHMHGAEKTGGMPLELTRQMKSMWGRAFVMIMGLAMFAASSSLAGGLSYAGVGVRARAMGGAFRGVADDWSAASYNPAGLAFMKASELNVSLGTYTPGMAYTPNLSPNDYDIGFKDRQKRYPLDELFPIPSFGGVGVPSESKGWVFGGAIYWTQDANYGWDLFKAPDTYYNDYQFAEGNFRTDLDVIDFHPVAAKKINDNLSVGAGLSLTNGDLVFRKILFVANPFGAPFDDLPYNNFLGDFRIDGKGFSVGANGGVLWKLNDKLSLGISAQTPVTIKVKGNATLSMAWPKNTALATKQLTVVVEGDTLKPDVFFSGNYSIGNSRKSDDFRPFKMDMRLPAQLGAGLGWTASSKLTLAFDAAVTFWSVMDKWVITFENGGLNTGVSHLDKVEVPFNWKDQIRLSAGAEYMAREDLVVRGGLYYDGTAAPDSTFGPGFPDVGNRIGLTFGGSYMLNGHFEVGVAEDLGFYSKRNVPTSAYGVGQTVYPGEYSALRVETLLSMSYRF